MIVNSPIWSFPRLVFVIVDCPNCSISRLIVVIVACPNWSFSRLVFVTVGCPIRSLPPNCRTHHLHNLGFSAQPSQLTIAHVGLYCTPISVIFYTVRWTVVDPNIVRPLRFNCFCPQRSASVCLPFQIRSYRTDLAEVQVPTEAYYQEASLSDQTQSVLRLLHLSDPQRIQ